MIRNYCVFNSILSRACYLKKNPASCIKTRSRDLENEAKGSRNRREHPIRQISPVLLSRGETEVHQRKNAQTMRIFVFYSTPRKRWMFHTRAEVSFFLFPFFFFFLPSSPPRWCNRWKPETENRIVYLKKTRDAGQAFANVHGLDDIIAAKASLEIFPFAPRAKGKRT